MKIAIVGTGYVGLVTGTCFAEMGVEVFCVDIDRQKIENLRNGVVPIYEPGLEEMVIRNYEVGRLHFTTDLTEVLDQVEIVFSAVGTPPDEDGSADLKYVLDVARTIGRAMNKYLLVVTKSTVPVGTARRIRQTIADELDRRGVTIDFDIASNPEFLKEGAAVKDFIPSAEMTKYAANAMLATRISFMNDMANLCEIIGADINMVRKGIGADTRIGSSFLYAGCGYGGSCFPKDVKALISTASDHGYPMRILQAVEDVNEEQKTLLFRKLSAHFDGDLRGRKVAMWGLAFKPETDDMREAPSLVLIDRLLEAGCQITAYDPVAIPEARRRIGDRIAYANNIYETVEGADVLMVVTEWKEFRLPAWARIRSLMKTPLILDGRNIYNIAEIEEAGFTYHCIGR